MKFILLFVYLLMFFILFFVQKKHSKISLVENSFITLVAFMCYISLSMFIFDKLSIHLNIINLIFCNLIVLFVEMIFLLKKNIQKISISKNNVIFLSIMFIITISILFYTFGFKFNVSFYSPDAAAHFVSAKYFALSNNLNANIGVVNTQNYGDGFLFFFYTNLGIIYKIMPNISITIQYYIFVIYNFIIFFGIGTGFYLLLNVINTKSKKCFVLKITISLLFTLGLPLNVFLYGFSYWNTSILIIELILLIIAEYCDFMGYFSYLTLFLGLFGLFCSYSLFVPVIYFSVFFFLLKTCGGIKKIFTKKFLLIFLIVMFIPFVLGFTYFIFPILFENGISGMSGLSLEGTIFIDIISNILLLIPISFYSILGKDKKDYLNNIFIYTIIYCFIIFALSLFGFISGYYFSKTLIILWLFVWYHFYKGMVKLCSNNKEFMILYFALYLLLLLVSLTDLDEKIVSKNDVYNNSLILNRIFSVYTWNCNYVKNPSKYFENNDLYVLEYIKVNNISNKNNELMYNGNYVQKRWFEVFTDKFPNIDYDGWLIQYKLPSSYTLWFSSNNDYFVYDKRNKFIDFYEDDNLISIKNSKNLVIKKKILK